MIPYGRQYITEDDVSAVVEVLTSDWLTQGPKVPEFENFIKLYTGSSHAVAMNSATSALHAACLALDLGPGDLLWTVPNTFVASANCGLLCGADVDFVDIDANSYCIDPTALSEKLENAEMLGRLPKVLVPVHFAGQSANMEAVRLLTKHYGIKIIEDASHAIGGSYLDKKIGCCEFSEVTVFSFHPVKIITTAEGGVATTNDPQLAERMRRIRTHGITRDSNSIEGEHCEPWTYQQLEIGLNYRMTDLQAALGVSQSAKLDTFVSRRRQLAQQYDDALADLPLICPWQDTNGVSSRHLYPVLINTNRTKFDRKFVFDYLRESDIGVNVHYIPVHTQPFYRRRGFKIGDFPLSEWYYSRTISLPLYYGLSDDDQQIVIDTLRDAFESG